MKKIVIVLSTPDETYEVQGKIVDSLISKAHVPQRNIVEVTEESITIESNMPLPLVKQVILRDYHTTVNMSQSEFCDGGASSPSAGAGDATGSNPGMGDANLRGTDTKPKKINVDDVLHDQSQYSATDYPVITYHSDSDCTITMIDQSVFSVGQLTADTVDKLNEKLHESWTAFSAGVDENSGSPSEVERKVQVDALVPQHQTYEKMMESGAKMDPYITVQNDKLHADARDPERTPVANMLIRDLSDVFHKGERTDKRIDNVNHNNENESLVPKLEVTELPRVSKPELIQRLLAFSATFDIDEDNFSVMDRVVAGAVTGAAANTVARKMGADQQQANRVGKAVGANMALNMNRNLRAVSNGAKSLVRTNVTGNK